MQRRHFRCVKVTPETHCVSQTFNSIVLLHSGSFGGISCWLREHWLWLLSLTAELRILKISGIRSLIISISNCILALNGFRSRSGDLNLKGGMKNFKTAYEDKMICFSEQEVMLLCSRNNNFG